MPKTTKHKTHTSSVEKWFATDPVCGIDVDAAECNKRALRVVKQRIREQCAENFARIADEVAHGEMQATFSMAEFNEPFVAMLARRGFTSTKVVTPLGPHWKVEWNDCS